MTTWTFTADAGKIETISLSKKNNSLDIILDDSTYAMDALRNGNNLELAFFKSQNGYFYEETLTIKNYLTYSGNVNFSYSGKYTGKLKDYFDSNSAVYMGNYEKRSSQTLKGSELSEVIMGGLGKDKIYSNDGNDIIMGGAGNDTIYGGEDNNVYVLSDNFGTDTIYIDDTKFNLITFYNAMSDSGLDVMDKKAFDCLIPITPNSLKSFERNGNDLKVTIEHNLAYGTLILKNYFNDVAKSENAICMMLDDGTGKWSEFTNYLTSIGKNTNITTQDFVEIMKNATLNNATFASSVSSLKSLISDTQWKDFLTLGYRNEEEGALNKKAINIVDSGLDETIYGGAGSDKITITGGKDIVKAGAGTNTINILDNVKGTTIDSGDGSDKITLGDDTDKIQISANDGNNTIKIGENSGSYVNEEYGITIGTGIGHDRITIDEECKGIYIHSDITYGAKGNDTITIGEESSHIFVSAGDGKNTITAKNDLTNSEFITGRGNDSIKVGTNADNIEITTGDGNDTISIADFANNLEIDAFGGAKNTITIGKGSGHNAQIGEEYGISIETGSRSLDTITIKDNCYGIDINATEYQPTSDDTAKIKSPNYDTISLGKNSQKIKVDLGNGGNKVTIGEGSGTYYYSTSGDFEFEDRFGIKVTAGDGKETVAIKNDCKGIYLDLNKNELEEVAGDKVTVGNRTENIYILAGNSSTISVGSDAIDTSITTNEGKNKITIGSRAINLGISTNYFAQQSATYGNDTISVGANVQNATIESWAGDDRITIGKNGEKIYVNSGDGGDKITIGSTSGYTHIVGGAGDDTISTSAAVNDFRFNVDDKYDEDPTNDVLWGKDSITVSKGSINTLNFNGIDADRLFYMYDKNNIVIGYEGSSAEDYALVTIKNANTKSYKDKNTQVNIRVNDGDFKIDTMVYDYSGKRGNQTIRLTNDFAVNNVLASFLGSDKIYVAGGETHIVSTDNKADTIYADKANGFDITKDTIEIDGDEKDKLVITGQGGNDLKIFFDIDTTSNFGPEINISTGKYFEDGINLCNYSDGKEMFNNITNDGKKLNSAAIDEIKQDVVSWLNTNNEFSVSTAMASASYTDAEKAVLLECFTQTENALWV